MEVNKIQVKRLEEHKTNPEYYTDKKQVFIIGSKGIPAAYGGFETFVEKLTQNQKNHRIRYHVARLGKDTSRFEYNGAKCFNVKVPDMGAARAIYYDIAALSRCISYCRARPSIEKPIFYVLACRIGPFLWYFKKKIKKLGGSLYINPDGHEWKRAKWSMPVRKYWKLSEKLMVKHADLIICDSRTIEAYIRKDYKKYHPVTEFIAYGSDTKPSVFSDHAEEFVHWLKKNNLRAGRYYLVVGRFVPENNYEIMIREFMKSNSPNDFVIITTADEAFLEELEEKLNFRRDHRIKFAGTVYEQELLKKIRENACGYMHGHEVGGTNPSLLEALGSTDLNLLLDVGFNREVGGDAALYWTKEDGSLSHLIEAADRMDGETKRLFGKKAKQRILEEYSWEKIVTQYENIFSKGISEK